jgi:hypothetical protein
MPIFCVRLHRHGTATQPKFGQWWYQVPNQNFRVLMDGRTNMVPRELYYVHRSQTELRDYQTDVIPVATASYHYVLFCPMLGYRKPFLLARVQTDADDSLFDLLQPSDPTKAFESSGHRCPQRVTWHQLSVRFVSELPKHEFPVRKRKAVINTNKKPPICIPEEDDDDEEETEDEDDRSFVESFNDDDDDAPVVLSTPPPSPPLSQMPTAPATQLSMGSMLTTQLASIPLRMLSQAGPVTTVPPSKRQMLDAPPPPPNEPDAQHDEDDDFELPMIVPATEVLRLGEMEYKRKCEVTRQVNEAAADIVRRQQKHEWQYGPKMQPTKMRLGTYGFPDDRIMRHRVKEKIVRHYEKSGYRVECDIDSFAFTFFINQTARPFLL